MITAEQIKAARMRATMFMDGEDPKHIQVYQCIEFPRLTKSWTKYKDGRAVTVIAVDGNPVELDGLPAEAQYQMIANALNTPEVA